MPQRDRRNAPINSKVQHPPEATPWAFDFLKIGLFKFPSLGAKKSRSNAPPISTKLPLFKDKFRLQSNALHASVREIYAVISFERVIH